MTSLTWDRHRGHASSYGVVAHGYNYRLDELHAALGREQLKKLASNNGRRRKLRYSYKTAIDLLDGWLMPFRECIEASSAHLMVAVAPTPEARDRATKALREAGIQFSMHYPCIADFEAFARWRAQALPITRRFVSRAITLPLYPTMVESGPAKVCDLIAASARVPSTL